MKFKYPKLKFDEGKKFGSWRAEQNAIIIELNYLGKIKTSFHLELWPNTQAEKEIFIKKLLAYIFIDGKYPDLYNAIKTIDYLIE